MDGGAHGCRTHAVATDQTDGQMNTVILLADRTNGRAYATVLRVRLSIISSVTYALRLNGAYYRKTD